MTDTSSLTLKPCVMVRVLQRSPVREIRTPGSARGLSGNRQFYLNIAMRPQIVKELRAVFAAKNRQDAERLLRQMVQFYDKGARLLATWLETNIPEGLNCFELPKAHQKRMRTTNMVERVNQELKRRTRVIRIFPNIDSLLRVITARLSELSDDWETGKVYLTMHPKPQTPNPKPQLLAA